LRLIPLNQAGPEEEEVPVEVRSSFWSLLGGAAWVVMTRGDIVVYIGFLQRSQQKPTWKHIKHLNTVVRWMKRKSGTLVSKKVQTPWQITVFPDSAFKATEPDCLAIRAAVILITSTDYFPKGGPAGVLEFYHRKQPRVCRSTYSAELSSVDDGVSHGLVMQGMLNEVVHGPLEARTLQHLMEHGRLPIPFAATTDNKGLFASVSADFLSVPTEPHLLYLLRSLRDRIDAGTLRSLWWVDTRDMISDVLTKGGLSREPILHLWHHAEHLLTGDAPVCFQSNRKV
jgi:hypothetical protein